VRHALRPADHADDGERPAIDPAAALAGVRLVIAPGSHEEAATIALALRHALERPGKTAALVTPDRTLARRVAAELARWDIAVDDSAGRPLGHAPPGAFLRLLARMAAEDAAPVPLLALLKHPLAAAGMAPPAFRAAVRALEIAALRGPRPAPGLAGLKAALTVAAEDAPRPPPSVLDGWIDRLERAIGPFLTLMRSGRADVAALLDSHVAAAEALAATADQTGPSRLWAGEAGEQAAGFVAELADAASSLGAVEVAEWPALFETLMQGRTVRPRWGLHPRLHIWGPLEARLQHADLVCLGGLNEGTWPADPAADPWMSRPMRARFGLPPPERRVGLAAHDFTQLFCAPEVLLTRAARVDGTPTVPSRWLLRLENALEAIGADAVALMTGESDGAGWLGWQAALDRPAAVRPIDPPAPRPPVAVRPRHLSVTRIESWVRDPYSIYARHILRLAPLDPIDADPGAADRGTMIHKALDDFVRAHPKAMPADALDRLLAFGRDAFREAMARPGVAAFWWPRFVRIAEWFVVEETAYRATLAETHTELRGELAVEAPAGPFLLSAMADRVDLLKDGGLSIVDYKTGFVPRGVEIAAGLAPQLPLEAAIAAAGGFKGIAARPVANLEFWRVTGGEPPGERKPAGADIGALARDALAGLAALVAKFDDPATPYLSQPDPDCPLAFPEYDHLARVQEWSSPGIGGEGD
jgi:ATP-dependent helicase/nuclease subunit B